MSPSPLPRRQSCVVGISCTLPLWLSAGPCQWEASDNIKGLTYRNYISWQREPWERLSTTRCFGKPPGFVDLPWLCTLILENPEPDLCAISPVCVHQVADICFLLEGLTWSYSLCRISGPVSGDSFALATQYEFKF